jgi:hypothetical protein
MHLVETSLSETWNAESSPPAIKTAVSRDGVLYNNNDNGDIGSRPLATARSDLIRTDITLLMSGHVIQGSVT